MIQLKEKSAALPTLPSCAAKTAYEKIITTEAAGASVRRRWKKAGQPVSSRKKFYKVHEFLNVGGWR
jgi:hypothetical protein